MRSPDVIVVGAGVAGIAAAVSLSLAGAAVQLVEARRRLGGRATSFVDAPTGEVLDNCQHVTLGCCTRYRRLLDTLGASDMLRWHSTQYWAEPAAGDRERVTRIEPGRLPAPLHYAGSFASAAFLTVEEKLAIASGIRELAVTARGQWEDRTFASWLDAAAQPEGARRKFWEPVIVSACNAWPDRVCASPAMKVFQDGLLASREASMIGVPRVPLVRLYEQLPAMLESTGGRVTLGQAAAMVQPRSVTLVDGSVLHADRVVCALPLEKAVTAVRDERGEADEGLTRLASRQAFSPIVGVHLEFDRDVMELPHAVLVGAATQWIFGHEGDGRRLHAVVSGADEWVEWTQERIVEQVLSDMGARFPRAMRSAMCVRARVVKERRATFEATPAFERARRALRRRDAAVPLAGDYTDTDWPATMEGATISGFEAARRLGGRVV
jgi:squalene-associated FAD-dependent desaturase